MTGAEVTKPHTRILKCALEVEDARAYWKQTDGTSRPTAKRAFDEYWFGAKSMARVEVLLANFRHRFDAYPPSLSVLHRWPEMAPDVRRLICHWHLQLADPLYRELTSDVFPSRRERGRHDITRDAVIRWVGEQSADWTMPTRIQFASKFLSAALAAGLVTSRRDPRPLVFPRVPDEALEYLLYLLRNVQFEGRITDNAYLRSVGLDPALLADRLRTIESIQLRRAGEIHDLTWRHSDLESWANAQFGQAA